MSILNRPYAGTWAPNRRSVVQWTPDFLVYLNGDTSLPGCQVCHHNIDIQEFVNSLSVDFGVEPGASNCSVSMSIPRHYGDSIFRDGNTLLRPGLEIHVYFRGYFAMTGLASPGARPVAGVNLAEIPQYPYYPVFHGVVTSVTHEYSGGFYTASMTCAGMLHFWEHQKLSGASGGSFFGARPSNSGIQTTLTGHPMSGKSPYGIIYSLYRDTAGVADGVGFALSSRTNYSAVNTTTNDPLYALTLRYWEQRFRGKIYGLRMHGASGQMFTSSQQAFLSLYRTNAYGGNSGTATISGSAEHPTDEVFAQDPTVLLGLRVRGRDGRVLRQIDTRMAGAISNGGGFGLDVAQMQAFPTNIGAYGQVNLWESTYESKMDIATAVTGVCGYEFYQDADGDLVFKPPLYNLDTSSSRVYRIEPEDIVSINFTEGEPAATYCIVKGGAFQNMQGVVDEAEWGCRSTYVDYKLVAQFGWIEASVESSYFTDPRSAFFYAINHLDRTNAGVNGCSVTIPLRPEIRPGYPVYIRHIDCFYYVTQVSHSFNLGAECTTTLTLTARRRKFLPPGTAHVTSSALDQNLTQVDLSKTANPSRVLHTLDNSGCPRIIGFPNVVMAIDPMTINPLFTTIGFQAVERELTELSSTRAGNRSRAETQRANRQQVFVWNFIRMMLNRTPAILEPVTPNTAGSTLTPEPSNDFLAENENQTYGIVGTGGANSTRVTIRVGDIREALTRYIENRSTLRQARAVLVDMLVSRQNSQNSARAEARRAGSPTPATNPSTTGTTSGQDRGANPSGTQSQNWYQTAEGLTSKIEEFDRNFNYSPTNNLQTYVTYYNTLARIVTEVSGASNRRVGTITELQNFNLQDPQSAGSRVVLMSFLIDQFRVARPQTGDIQTDPSGTVNTSANLLEMLSDRKASLNLTVPGHYRYYSASHPNPDMQGYAPLSETPSTEGSVEGVTEISVDRNGRPVGQLQDVGYRGTPMRPQEAVVHLRNAWRTLHNGQNPSREVLAMLASQWAHENSSRQGAGQAMFNNNFGGVHWDRVHRGPGQRALLRGRDNTRAWFQSYANADEGARHYVWLLALGRHREAFLQYEQALSSGSEAAVRAYAQQLKRSRYYEVRPNQTDPDSYEHSLQRIYPNALRWVDEAGFDNSSITPQGDRDPASSRTSRRNSPTAPETDNTAAVVRPVTNDDRIPPERRGEYVELGTHTPSKGLRVRVLEEDSTRVVPTNKIYSMTFESRGVPRTTRVAVTRFNSAQPGQIVNLINSCWNPPERFSLANSLCDSFARRVGSAAMTQARPTTESVGELITAAVSSIQGLRNRNGAIGRDSAATAGSNTYTIWNITDGAPNNFNPCEAVTTITGSSDVRARALSRSVLLAKARALIADVTNANRVDLTRAIGLLNGLGQTSNRNATLPQEIQDLLSPWKACLDKLFNGAVIPPGGPFQSAQGTQLSEDSSQQFSPVFPVSDALGYEHYGSFQYGRGLSIEPGGNYEQLMATDPLQFATDIQRERFLRALRSNPGDPARRAEAVRNALTDIANDPEFVNGPGAQVALGYNPDPRNGDRTTQISNGLANYIMSDRDAVMKLPVNNVAYRLADLQPQGTGDGCGCRGAEADLLLAAYMSGTQSFAIIDSEDEATNWAAAQMAQASVAWSQAQEQMRGMASSFGRRSLLDNVEGWQNIATGYRQSVERVEQGAQSVRINTQRVGAQLENVVSDTPRPVPPRQ